ncbi:MAG: aminopeptidase P family protein [Chloroflexi bacterium]|nr:aminopeptidase P family protein [Chloroflexota bacterium]
MSFPHARRLSDAPLTAESLGVPDERTRYILRKQIIHKKLNTTLLPAMRAHGIDMWIILSREFHPDPFLPDIGGGWPGVRNAYIFFDNGGDTPEKIFIGSHEQREDIFQVYDQLTYYGYNQEGLAPHLRDAVHQRNPKRIGVNMSKTLPMADGLSAVLKEYLEDAIGVEYAQRLTTAELVARDFRATRIAEEESLYRRVCEWTVAWEEEAFGPRVVTPGITTADDIHWWMRAKARALGMDVEFLPGTRIIREGKPLPVNSSAHPILPGDVIFTDAGLAFDLLRTDYKRTAYVLRPGESAPPASLQRAFRDALRVRDELTARMLPGKIAHVVWDETMEWVKAQGYQVTYPAAGGRREAITVPQVGIYCHSIGNATHGIGARVAVDWPMAYGDRVRYPLRANEWYSIELGVNIPIPEWDGRAVSLNLEENAKLTERGIEYLTRTQTEFLLIPS